MRTRMAVVAAAGFLALGAGAGICEEEAGSLARRGDARAPQVGQKAPDLVLEQLLQAPTKSAASWNALKGKTVVLEFWSTGCGPCLKAIPHLNELAEGLKDRPVQFIAVTRDPVQRIAHFIAKRKMAAWVGIDKNGDTFSAYGVRGIPRTVLVDSNGTIAAVTHPMKLGIDDIEKVITGKAPGRRPRGGERCDLRKGVCGEADDEEAVTVTLSKSEDPKRNGRSFSGPGRIVVTNMRPARFLPRVYSIVYGMPMERIELNATLPKDVRYDLNARAPSRENSALQEPLKTAVEKEFRLESRLETKETHVYVLTVDPEKKALVTAAEKSDDRGVVYVDERQIVLINRPIEDLVRRMERFLTRPVVDETGLEETYDLVAEWKGEGVQEMAKAMRDSLGLVLTPARRPVEMLTVTNAKGKGGQ